MKKCCFLVNPLIAGELQLRIEVKQHRLEVFVAHARALGRLTTGAAPNPYVKCYLRHPPTHTRHMKRKTRLIDKQTNPTYNEIVSGRVVLN